MTNKLKSLWAGEVPLPQAFWTYAVGYGLIVNAVTSFLFFLLLMRDVSPWLLVPVYVLPTPYNVLAIVAVWRSADRYQGPDKWADLARAATVIGMVLLSVT